jgi:hypothetical protein
MIRPADYVRFLMEEYLHDFVRDGGAAVKFVVPLDGADSEEVHFPLREAAAREDFVVAHVDGRTTKLHMMDRIFHDIARQVDWDGLAGVVAGGVLRDFGFATDGPDAMDLERIAERHDRGYNLLRIQFSGQLETEVLKDYDMAQDFRLAMHWLALAQVDPAQAAQARRLALLDWLRGDLKRISELRNALIFQKIARNNARHMLFSLTRWVRKAGKKGLVLLLDIRQLAVARRQDAGEGLHYTKAAVLDAYEVLRQLIDGTDELGACLVVVSCAPEFLSDPVRGLESYHALRDRVADDVRDRARTNPFSALVRVSRTAEPRGGRP